MQRAIYQRRTTCCISRCKAHQGPHQSALVVIAVAAGLADVACAFAPFGIGRLEWNVNANIVLGQSAVFSGPNKDLGILMRRGILAAFFQYNQALEASPFSSGKSLGLISYDDGYNGDPARDNTIQLIEVDKVLAIVGEVGTPTSVLAAPEAVSRQVPFIGAFTGASFLRTPFERHIINYRASYIDEAAAMVKFFTSAPLFFNRISLFRQNDSFGLAVREGVVEALRSRRMRIYSEGTYEKNTVIVTPGLEAMASQTRDRPDAIIMVGTYSALSRFIIEAKARTGWSDCVFSTVSFVGPTSLSEYLGNEGNRSNVFITQTVPFPQDTSIQVVGEYQKAMEDWQIATGEDGTPDFTSFEGYMVGMMVAEFVRQVARRLSSSNVDTSSSEARRDQVNLTVFRRELLNQCYDFGIFQFHSFRLGPYGGYCDQTATGCHCNQGQRQVYGTMINGDGSFSPNHALDFSFPSCGYQGSKKYIAKFGLTAALSGPYAHLGLNMQLGIQAAFYEASSNVVDGQITVHFVPELVSLDDEYLPELAEANVLDLLYEHYVFALVGSVGTPATRAILNLLAWIQGAAKVPFLGPLTGSSFLRAPPWTEEVINVRASYTDECVAMVHYYVSEKNFSKISLFIQDDSYGGADGLLGLDIALRAYGLNIHSVGRYLPLPECNCTALINCPCSNVTGAVDAISATQPQAIVMFASAEHAVVFVKQMLQRVGSCDGDCFFAAHACVGSDYLLQHLDTTALHQNLIVTQVVPLYTDTDLELIRSYQDAMMQYVRSRDANSVPHYNYVSLEGYMVGKLAVRVMNRLAIQSRSEFLSKVFETRTISLATNFDVGPYEQVSNSSRGCNQGMRIVYLTRIVEGGSQEELRYQYVDESPTYTFPNSCGLTAENMACHRGLVRIADSHGNRFQQLYREMQNETCKNCPPGSSTDGVTCTKCAAGRYWQAGNCTACDPGTYNSQEGRTLPCEVCPSGRFVEEVGNIECKECAIGRWRDLRSDPGAEACLPCLPGKFRGAAEIDRSCQHCPIGTFSWQSGSTECEACTTVLLNSITEFNGASKEEDCVCESGHYGTRHGMTEYGLSQAKGRCISCGPNGGLDIGLSCPGGRTVNGSSIPGVTSPSVLAHFMVWPVPQIPDELPLQLRPYSCGQSAGGSPCVGTHAIWDLAEMCEGGREGLACGRCPENHYRGDAGCHECTITLAGTIFWYGVYGPLFGWMIYVLMKGFGDYPSFSEASSQNEEEDLQSDFATFSNSRFSTRIHKRTNRSVILFTASDFRSEVFRTFASISKRLLGFVQIVGVVLEMFPPLRLRQGGRPPAGRGLFRFTHRLFTAESQFWNNNLQLECVVGSDFKALFTGELCAPLFVCVCLCFNCGAYQLVVVPIQSLIKQAANNFRGRLRSFMLKCAGVQIRWILTFDAIGNLMTALFISFTNLTMSLLMTYPHPMTDLGTSVQRFPDVLEGSDEWKVMLAVSTLFFLLYCICTLSVCMWACWIAPLAILKDREFALKWDFLIGDFHPSVWWWGVVLLIRGLLWNLWVTLAPNSLIASVIFIVGFAYSVAFTFAWMPWGGAYSNLKNCMDTVCNLGTCMLIPAMSLRAYYNQGTISTSQKAMEIVESAAIVLPVIATTIAILYTLHSLVHRKRTAVSIFTTSQDLKALLMLMMRASNSQVHQFWADLNDTDKARIWYVIDTFYAEILGLHPPGVFSGRLIKSSDQFTVSSEDKILRRIEKDLMDGKHDFMGLHERALVQWVLEQMFAGYAAICRDDRRVKTKSAFKQYGKILSLQGSGNSGKHTIGRRVIDLHGMYKEINHNGDGIVDMHEFRRGGWLLAPLCTSEELDECFALLDGEGLGYFNEDRFVVLLKQWTKGSKMSDPEFAQRQIQSRNTLLRLSMKAKDGERTIERWSRHSRVRRQIISIQRRFRERRKNKLLTGINVDQPNLSVAPALPQTNGPQEQLNESAAIASMESKRYALGVVAEEATTESEPRQVASADAISVLAQSLGEQRAAERMASDSGGSQQEFTEDGSLPENVTISDFMGPIFALPIRSPTRHSVNVHRGMQNGALTNHPQGALTMAEADRNWSLQLSQDVRNNAHLSDWLGPVFGADRSLSSPQQEDTRWSRQLSPDVQGRNHISDWLGPVFEAESSHHPRRNAGVTGLLGPEFFSAVEKLGSREVAL